MEKVRLGVVGVGGSMAGNHQNYFDDIEALDFIAGSDIDAESLAKSVEDKGIKGYDDASAMIASGEVDAILIACPHYDHPRYAMEAFDAGVHVLCEKPIAVTALAAQEVIDA
ncbi:MAG: Gfo/Idh/MocA family oxidoreductase [Planctomycetota bacterium]